MKNRGFTLIEVLLYMGLFALISVVALSALGGMSKALSTLRANRGTTDATVVAFERMVREIQNATSTNAAQSTFGLSPGTLVLNSNNTTVTFFLSGTTLMVQEGSAGASSLLPSGVSFSSLLFRRARTSASEGVKIEAVVNGKIMNTTAVIRGSY